MGRDTLGTGKALAGHSWQQDKHAEIHVQQGHRNILATPDGSGLAVTSGRRTGLYRLVLLFMLSWFFTTEV